MQLIELEKDSVIKQSKNLLSRKTMLHSYAAVSSVAFVLDVASVIISASTVNSEKDAIRCVLSVCMVALDVRLLVLLQQPSSYYTGEKAFTCTTLYNAVSLHDLFGNEETNASTTTVGGKTVYDMGSLKDDDDNDDNNLTDDDIETQLKNTNLETLMSGVNNTILDTRASVSLEKHDVNNVNFSPEKRR